MSAMLLASVPCLAQAGQAEAGLCVHEFQGVGIHQGGVMTMRLLWFLRHLWHGWRALWQWNWDGTAAPDFHKWESKVEIRQRLSGRHF